LRQKKFLYQKNVPSAISHTEDVTTIDTQIEEDTTETETMKILEEVPSQTMAHQEKMLEEKKSQKLRKKKTIKINT
jgi:hypothetical protein